MYCFFIPFCGYGISVLPDSAPIEKLQGFAKNIAQGNFDVPLKYERCNYFGAFTWAFDSMRKEIIKARAAEREAVENNKTVIATLSPRYQDTGGFYQSLCGGAGGAYGYDTRKAHEIC